MRRGKDVGRKLLMLLLLLLRDGQRQTAGGWRSQQETFQRDWIYADGRQSYTTLMYESKQNTAFVSIRHVR